jgi:ATP-dependent DNA ligase
METRNYELCPFCLNPMTNSDICTSCLGGIPYVVIDLRNKLNIELPRCRGAYLEDCPEWVWGHRDQVIEPKMEGDRISMQIGEMSSLLVSRNRLDFLKGVKKAKAFNIRNDANKDLAEIACKDLAGTILDGELTDTRTKEGVMDKDTLLRKEQGSFVGFTVWQCLFYNGEDIRHYSDDMRRHYAKEVIKKLKKLCKDCYPYVRKIRLIERKPATLENLKKYLDANWEGVIVKDKTKPLPKNKDGKYQRTNTFWWKVKGEEKRTVDAFIVGVTEATSGGSGVKGIARKPNGKAATFTMAMKASDLVGREVNIEVAVMSNLPDNVKEDGLKNFKKYKGRVVEMRVSGWDGERFRWPRFEKWRTDKTPSDCLLEEQVGGKNDQRNTG